LIASNENGSDELLSHLEGASGQIQLLALNIAIAAAKITHQRDLGLEVNQRLSQLVNQATQAVRQMNHILSLAGSNSANQLSKDDDQGFDPEIIQGIENSMESIIADSERITHILSSIKKRE
jgi:methyl-accepting chemotaxis protein